MSLLDLSLNFAQREGGGEGGMYQTPKFKGRGGGACTKHQNLREGGGGGACTKHQNLSRGNYKYNDTQSLYISEINVLYTHECLYCYLLHLINDKL